MSKIMPSKGLTCVAAVQTLDNTEARTLYWAV